MTAAQQIAIRVNVLQSCIDEMAAMQQGRKINYPALLLAVYSRLKEYPPFAPDMHLSRADRLVVMSMAKIGFGLVGDLPANAAAGRAFNYLSMALGFLSD